MKNIILIGILIIIVAIIAIFAFNKSGANPNSTNSTSTATNQNISPNNIIIQNFAFNPDTLTIKTGTTITWTNNDSVVHNIKSSLFNSPDLNISDTFKFTFNTHDAYHYSFCKTLFLNSFNHDIHIRFILK